MSNELAVMLKNHLPEIRAIAPKYVNPERLTALALQAKMRNPLLAQCSPESVINFCLKCAEAGTDRVGAGGMWAVPFRNNKTGKYEMAAIPDWRLLIEKARRAKVIKNAWAEAVYDADVFSYEMGLNPNLIHKPKLGKERGRLIYIYAVITLPDGEKTFTVMRKEEIDAIRARSKAATAGPWVTDYSQMAIKTCLKRALKVFEGASPELTKLIDADNAVVGYADLDIEPIAEPKELPVAPVAAEPAAEPVVKRTTPLPEAVHIEAVIKAACRNCGSVTLIGVESKLCAACQNRPAEAADSFMDAEEDNSDLDENAAASDADPEPPAANPDKPPKLWGSSDDDRSKVEYTWGNCQTCGRTDYVYDGGCYRCRHPKQKPRGK
jgi:recombination protein RecT